MYNVEFENGKLSRLYWYAGDGSVAHEVYNYKWSGDTLLKQWHESGFNDVREYRYSKDYPYQLGEIVTYEGTFDDKWGSSNYISLIDIKYDQYHNWISRERVGGYEDGIQTRTITYYPLDSIK